MSETPEEPDTPDASDEPKAPGAHEEDASAEASSEEARARVEEFFADAHAQNTSRRSIEETGSRLFKRTRVVLGVFSLVVALAVFVGASRERAELAEMTQWPTVMGEVRSSRSVSDIGMDIIVYEVHYNAMGQKFRSKVNMQARADAPRMGDVIPLKLDPDDPMRVSLAPEVGERVIFSDKAIFAPAAIGGALLLSLLMF